MQSPNPGSQLPLAHPLILEIMEILDSRGTNRSNIPFAMSYERNVDTNKMEWTAYADHRGMKGHYDCLTTSEESPAHVLTKMIHRLKRELR